MGYRVSQHCFATIDSATDFVMSQVVPAILPDGSLVHPVKQGSDWTYNGHVVQLSLPTCDPMSDYKDGQAVGAMICVLMLIAFGIKLSVKMLYRADRADIDD